MKSQLTLGGAVAIAGVAAFLASTPHGVLREFELVLIVGGVAFMIFGEAVTHRLTRAFNSLKTGR